MCNINPSLVKSLPEVVSITYYFRNMQSSIENYESYYKRFDFLGQYGVEKRS